MRNDPTGTRTPELHRAAPFDPRASRMATRAIDCGHVTSHDGELEPPRRGNTPSRNVRERLLEDSDRQR